MTLIQCEWRMCIHNKKDICKAEAIKLVSIDQDDDVIDTLDYFNLLKCKNFKFRKGEQDER